uniref:outer membrane protein assembly factor BamE n=1 Tax=Yoonia sp. TaxID=2212373 RepID=UPI0035C81139
MGRTSVRLRNALCVIGLLTVTAACGSIDRFTGYLPSEAEVESLQVGISTKEDAIAVFGPPLADRALENNTIYYAASQIRTLGPFAPRIVDRQVLAVAFDSDDV